MAIPHEPGLYWASKNIEGEFDSILRAFGKSPFLNWEIIPLHVSCRGKVISPYRHNDPVVGPRVAIPSSKESP